MCGSGEAPATAPELRHGDSTKYGECTILSRRGVHPTPYLTTPGRIGSCMPLDFGAPLRPPQAPRLSDMVFDRLAEVPLDDLGDGLELVAVHHSAGRVVGIAEHQRAGSVGERLVDALQIVPPAAGRGSRVSPRRPRGAVPRRSPARRRSPSRRPRRRCGRGAGSTSGSPDDPGSVGCARRSRRATVRRRERRRHRRVVSRLGLLIGATRRRLRVIARHTGLRCCRIQLSGGWPATSGRRRPPR